MSAEINLRGGEREAAVSQNAAQAKRQSAQAVAVAVSVAQAVGTTAVDIITIHAPAQRREPITRMCVLGPEA